MYETLESWNLRGRYLLTELRAQVELYSCAGGVWTQTTDVEGEINGMLTYDRRILRTDVPQWRADIQVRSLFYILYPTVSYCLRYGRGYCTIYVIVNRTLISIRLCTTHLRAVRIAQPKASFVQRSISKSTNIHSTGHEEETEAASLPLALILTFSLTPSWSELATIAIVFGITAGAAIYRLPALDLDLDLKLHYLLLGLTDQACGSVRIAILK